jgi:hypothetical protein
VKVVRTTIALVFAASLAIVAACSSDLTTAPVPASQPSEDLIGGLLTTVSNLQIFGCSLPFASGSKVIGPDGGTLRVGDATLEIPSGALTTKITISGHTELLKTGIAFAPEGLKFQKPVKLTVYYSSCSLLPKAPFRMVYVSPAGSILEAPPSEDYRSERYIKSTIQHFSSYELAY